MPNYLRGVLLCLLGGASGACATELRDSDPLLSGCELGEAGCSDERGGGDSIVFHLVYFPVRDGMISNNGHQDQLELVIDGERTGTYSTEMGIGGRPVLEIPPGKHVYTLHPIQIDDSEEWELPELRPAVATLPELRDLDDHVIVAFGDPEAPQIELVDFSPPADLGDDSVRYTVINLDPTTSLDVVSWPEKHVCQPQEPDDEPTELLAGLEFGEVGEIVGLVSDLRYLTDGAETQRFHPTDGCGSSYELMVWLPPFDWIDNPDFPSFHSVAFGAVDHAACRVNPRLTWGCL